MKVEFDCIDCQQHIVSLGVDKLPEDGRCVVCQWLAESVADPAEREAMRDHMTRLGV